MAEEEDIDHYAVLGIPSGEQSSSLSLKEIEKAYRTESRKRHPDKRPDDPNATADFQLLTSSFNILRDPTARSAFDSRLRARRDRLSRQSHHDAKRRKLATDLDARERAAESAVDPAAQAQRREKKVAADLKRELEEFQARNLKKAAQGAGEERKNETRPVELDREKVLKVSWDKDGGDYTAAKLRELFERFGPVEDVVIRSKKKRGSAVVVMSSKESAVAATKTVSGSLSNPLLVLPLHVAPDTSSIFTAKYDETVNPKLSGSGFQDFEASILKKLEKAKERQNPQ